MKHIRKLLFVMVTLLIGYGSLMHAQEQKTWQWISQLGGRLWDKTSGVVCDSKNNLFIAGSFSDTLICENKKVISSGSEDIYLACFDEKGNIKDLWGCGGNERDQAACLTITKDNRVIIGGTITGEVVFNNFSISGSGTRPFIASINTKGKIQWMSDLTPSGESSLFLVGSDNLGRIYASGVFSDSLTTGEKMVVSNGKKDIFIARFSVAGAVEELKAFGSKEDDLPTAITVSDSGIVFLAGLLMESFKVDDVELIPVTGNAKSNAYILRFNKDFKANWSDMISGDEYNRIAAILQDASGNIYTAGSFNQNLWTEDTVMTSQGYSDGFILKYRSDGGLLWGRSFGSWYYDYVNHLIPDNLGGIMITGSMGDTLLIDELSVNPQYWPCSFPLMEG
jgi:hypothetical protein